jgi:hypothetical protein
MAGSCLNIIYINSYLILQKKKAKLINLLRVEFYYE